MDSYITWPYQIEDPHCRITATMPNTYLVIARLKIKHSEKIERGALAYFSL